MRLRCHFVDKSAFRVTPKRPIPCYGPRDVRRLRVVAGLALIAILAMVAVPGSAGSRGPSPAGTVDPGLFRPVDIQSLTFGTPTTVLPPDPGARSAGTLEPGSMFIEPQSRTEPAAGPIRDAQPAAEVGVIVVPPPTPKPTPAAKPAPVTASKAAAKSEQRAEVNAARRHDDHDRRVAPRPERFLVRARVLRPPNGLRAGADPRSHRCRCTRPCRAGRRSCSATRQTAGPCSCRSSIAAHMSPVGAGT